jgi:EAL domain-containing protein (putative c-di-GMP-specific phosphodiesterase class I)
VPGRVSEAVQNALTSQQISAAYQPICNLRGENPVVWWEALVRFNAPGLGAIPPNDIVETARQLDLLDELTDQVASQAFDLLSLVKEGRGSAGSGRGFSVNVEASQLGQWTPALDALVQRSRDTGIEVMVEVTERELNAWTDQHGATIDRLREAGVSVAIDDFGTGYAALGSLFRIPVDTIKIDRSMVESLTEPRQKLLLERIISTLHELGYTLVVEGVSSRNEFADLEALGVELVQSNLLAEPMIREAVLEWVTR